MENIKETILTYTSAWNETEREAILKKISKCWAPDGTYTDRLTDTITGPDAITDLIISSYGQMGPRTFQVLAEPQVHHQSGRFRWLAIRPEGYPVEVAWSTNVSAQSLCSIVALSASLRNQFSSFSNAACSVWIPRTHPPFGPS